MIIIVCLLGNLSMAILAQNPQVDYRPMAQDGKLWSTQVGLILENEYENRIDGDTLIEGVSWKKVYNSTFGTGFNSYYVALRDVGKKVYAIAKGSSRPRLLYDFGLKEGNTIRCGVEGNTFGCLLEKDEKPDTLFGFPFVSYLRVERIDTIEWRGQEYRRFTLTFLDAYHEPLRSDEVAINGNVVWVEGVGSGTGPFSPWKPLLAEGCIYLSCQINKEYLFSDFYRNYETAAIDRMQYIGKKSVTTYDLQGRNIGRNKEKLQGNNLPKGVYIQERRKVVVKE